MLVGPVDGICLREDVVSDNSSDVISGAGFIRDWVTVMAVLLIPFQEDFTIDGVSPTRNVVTVDGTPGVVFVHCAPGAICDIPTRRCSHVLS